MDYWDTHGLQPGQSFQRYFAREFLLRNPILKFLFSIRLGNEIFICRRLSRLSGRNFPLFVLDIGCGWGQHISRISKFHFYGVDIKGFPRESALGKGYKDAREYRDGLTIPYNSSFFDAAIMVNVTAHVPDDTLLRLLDEAKRCLKPAGVLLIAAECDNRGLSNKIMGIISKVRLKRLVEGMDHKNYKFEKELDRRLIEHGLEIKAKKTIIGHFLPFIQYWSFAFLASPYKQLRYLSIAADVILSILDNIASLLTFNMEGRRFITGYVCGIKDGKFS